MPRRKAFALLLLLTLLRALPALGAAALALPAHMLHATNKLQRAVLACEAGGQVLSEPAGEKGTRFFLGLTASQTATPPLRLFGGRLSGLGQISNAQGWFNIRFDCALRPDLLQASTFKFTVLSPAPMTQAAPPPPASAAPNTEAMRWSVTGATILRLAYGAPNGALDFAATCVRRGGFVKIALTRSLARLRPGDFVITSITDGPHAALYLAQLGPGDGAMPIITLVANDPLFQWMGKGAPLLINLGGATVYQVSQQDSLPAIAKFLHGCR